MINRTLDERYTILERVGGGGMADVYRAHDQLLDRSVAVKVLKSQFTDDQQFVARFRREAQAAAKLSHPNIVNIYDVGRDDNIDYIVMEYIPGETLKQRIDREAPLPVEKVVHIGIEIAEALEHAHQNNLIHCDVKPHNILMTTAGRVKVADFGIARAAASSTMTQTGTVLGSVHYFSPEQAKGSAVDAKSDIYSLGVVLYEMLTGQVPFTGETPIGIAIKHIQEIPQSPREINPAVPPILEAIILKALSKNPEERFKTAGEMIDDLRLTDNFLRDDQTRRISREDFPTQLIPKIKADEVSAYSHQLRSPNQPHNKWYQDKKWIAALIALLVLSFLVGAFLAYGKFWSSSEVSVPNVVGQQVDVAKSALQSKHLRVSVTEAFSDKVPAGFVISQNPEAGSVVKEERTITIVVSKGGEITVVPDIRGLSRRDAELKLKNAGLNIGKVTEESVPNVPPGTVVSQNPQPPTQINRGMTVDIVISKAEEKKVTLPNFIGSPLSTVTAQLQNLKLKVGNVSEAGSDKYPAGTVIAQTPEGGSQVVEGATIDLTVAKATGGIIKKINVQFTVPDGAARQSVQIVATDNNGRRIVYESVHRPGERIEKTVEGSGQVRIQIYANGNIVQDQTF